MRATPTPEAEPFPILTEIVGRAEEESVLGDFAPLLTTRIVFRGEFNEEMPRVKLAGKLPYGGAHTYGPVVAAMQVPFTTWAEVTRRDGTRYGVFCVPTIGDSVLMAHFEAGQDGAAGEMLPMLVEKMPCAPPPAIDWEVLATERYPGVKAYDRPRGRGMALENRRRWADWWELNVVVDSGSHGDCDLGGSPGSGGFSADGRSSFSPCAVLSNLSIVVCRTVRGTLTD